ncbi:hypothetical protein LSAT2_027642 [Lamellibrachia satsuma]|nr:hypothetical protein LSAT2_027642 [Lamellibrachia satsuma]
MVILTQTLGSTQVVASAIRIPWSDRVYYGSSYYVAKAHRRRSYGTRLRDQVAREHVGDHSLAIDAVLGKVADDDANKFDYVPASFLTRRAQIVVRDDVTADAASYSGCSIVQGNPVRAEFLRLWMAAAGGASYVAVAAKDGRLTGYGCRRPCVDDQRRTHLVGPLYADNASVAEALLRRLCADVVGETVVLDFWLKNHAALKMMEKFGFEKVCISTATGTSTRNPCSRSLVYLGVDFNRV